MLEGNVLDHLTGVKPNPARPFLDEMIRTMKEKGEMKRRITLEASVGVGDKDFVPGEYLAHLPFPVADAQQSEIELLSGDPDGLGEEKAAARTAWWKRNLTENREFKLRYRYVSHMRYADPLNMPAPDQELYPCDPPCEADLAESGVHLRFTPYMRQLAAEITEGAENDVQKAWKIYEFITTKIK